MRKFAYWIFLTYLRFGAKIQLLKVRPKHIVGITGSAGKTSCREAVTAILQDKYSVKQSHKGLNSEIGVPLDILGFKSSYSTTAEMVLKAMTHTFITIIGDWKKYDVLVAEMGIDSLKEPGNMGYLLKIVRPDIGVFLNAQAVHTEYYRTGKNQTREELIKVIAVEKGKLIKSLPREGFAVLNADDPNIMVLKDKTEARVITFGSSEGAQIRNFLVELPDFILTDSYGYTLAAAAAVGLALGVPVDESKQLLSKYYRLPPGRMSRLTGKNSSVIIDSTYNSSRVPATAALKLLREMPGKRKIAVLGDMRELGEISREEHKALAEEAVKDADLIYTFGPMMEKYFVPAAQKLKDGKFKPGEAGQKINPYLKMPELIQEIGEILRPGDVVLVKGSQNTIFLETLVEKILANPEDKNRLCRRGPFWDRKRAKLLEG